MLALMLNGHIEDCLCVLAKKFLPINPLCDARRHRDLSLAAATTAATAAAFTFTTAAVVPDV